jgi:Zn-dependent M32 family carboxypeptidase
MSEDEIRATLKNNDFNEQFINELIDNNNNLAESIKTEIDLYQALFPNYDTADDIKEMYDEVKDGLVISE